MKQFTRLNRAELKDILGGRLKPGTPDPKDDVECMLKSIGDICDTGSQCTRILYPPPGTGSYLRCINTTPDIPEG